MANAVAETLIGAVVLVVAGGFLAYAAQRTNLAVGAANYDVVAKFRKAEGLDIGSDVRVSGVKVGSVSSLTLDRQSFEAVVRLRIASDVQLPDDSDAAIASIGLLGGNFVSITPGASEFMIKPDGEIVQTQGSVSLIDLMLKFGSGAAE